VWLHQQQTLDQQLLQVLHREPVPEDAVRFAGLPRQDLNQVKPVA
jgi:hypothetical protein